MRTAIFALLVCLSACVASADDPYQWLITDPEGGVTTAEGRDHRFVPLIPGLWTIRLTVSYAHEQPPGQPYMVTTTRMYFVSGEDLRLIFADGFETGATGAWSITQGG